MGSEIQSTLDLSKHMDTPLGVKQSKVRGRSAQGELESVGARAQPSLERLRWTRVQSVAVADLWHTCITPTPSRRRWSSGCRHRVIQTGQ